MKIFSGVQPTGTLHIGNYLGSVLQWVQLLQENANAQAVFSIVDLHAITIAQDPVALKKRIFDVAAIYLAAGIDPQKQIIFVQSQNPDHASLGWILSCMTSVSQLERMTQYKDKKEKLAGYKEMVSAGLFTYPSLMAADILLYDTDLVPVGADQKQHVEITRDIAIKFNATYGETFVIPDFRTNKETSKLLDLQNPAKKMSKSDSDEAGRISLLDSADTIRQKIKRAVTDSNKGIAYDPENRPGVANLLALASSATGKEISVLVSEYEGMGYGEFKDKVAEAVVSFLSPLQEKIAAFLADKGELERVLDNGAERAKMISHKKMLEVSSKLGLYYHEKT